MTIFFFFKEKLIFDLQISTSVNSKAVKLIFFKYIDTTYLDKEGNNFFSSPRPHQHISIKISKRAHCDRKLLTITLHHPPGRILYINATAVRAGGGTKPNFKTIMLRICSIFREDLPLPPPHRTSVILT